MVKYLYSFTGNYGKTLFESLRDKDFYSLIEQQAKIYEEELAAGGILREQFVEHYLDKLKYREIEKLQQICKITPIREYFESHRFPEETYNDIREYAWEMAYLDAEGGILWDHVDKDSNTEVALNFGFVKYPPFNKETQMYKDGGSGCIPADIANEICRLTKESVDNSGNPEKIEELERTAVEDMIFVDGFYCDIHGGKATYQKPVKRSEVLTCPACGHPICPTCSNMYSEDPDTEDAARKYMESCDSISGMAYCGNCGDYSPEFMLGFLKLIGCPIPPEYQNFSGVPRENVEFYATATVSALPEFQDILTYVKKEWAKGTTGIIKVQHQTGEIWGWTDRYPDKWVVTVLYPEER